MLFSLDRNRKSANALLGLGLLLPLTIPGCGSPEVAVIAPVDPDKARGILTNALDAWKAGKDSNSLASQSPSVRVADEDWLAGMQLVSD